MQCADCVSDSFYLIRDTAVVVVPHADPDRTLDLIGGRPRSVVALSIRAHLHILMDDACKRKVCVSSSLLQFRST